MLVLTRKPGEVVVVGENIKVKVISIDRNKVRLGFIAPGEVVINRQELVEPPKRRANAKAPEKAKVES